MVEGNERRDVTGLTIVLGDFPFMCVEIDSPGGDYI